MEVLDPIPLTLDSQEIGVSLQVDQKGAWPQFESAFAKAMNCLEPKGAYAVRYVEARPEDGVVIAGLGLHSRVLRKNLDGVERVFPYVATIGAGIEQVAGATNDPMERHYLNAIGNMAVIQTREFLKEALQSRFALGRMAFMSPGSLEDWPIEEQRPLFGLLNGGARAIGVRLTDACLMVPLKSVSGIYFPTETTFMNCRLCPREPCVGRKADYSPTLAAAYGIQK